MTLVRPGAHPPDRERRPRWAPLLGVLALAAPALGAFEPRTPNAPALVTALVERWSGVYDNVEQVIYDARGLSPLTADDNQRVRTIVEPVALPWLGAHVLYLEELLHDEPDDPRRQVLLQLSAERSAGTALVRVRQFTFRDPGRWRQLFAEPQRLAELRAADLETIPGCDLLLVPEGDQFRGGTLGRRCLESTANRVHYVDYRVLVGSGLYWYRKRLVRIEDDELVTETLGFDWFELHQARLFACRIRWSRSGRSADLAPLAIVNLHDQGGRARFSTPDGQEFELELHSRDWPYARNRDALILLLRELGGGAPLSSSWADLSAEQISAASGPIDVHCGPIARSEGEDS